MENDKKNNIQIRPTIRVAALILGLIMLASGISFLYERLTTNSELGGKYPPDILWILFGIFSLIVAIRGRLFGKKPPQKPDQ